MSKQKSMGQVAHDSVGGLVLHIDGFGALSDCSKQLWEEYANLIIAEHERRKRAKRAKRRGKK